MAKTNLRRPARRSIIQRLLAPVGEISVLRNSWPSGWGFQYMTPYRLDSSRVDYDLARQLYRNTADKYKLGAGFAKPIVNTTAGFMGTPHFTHPGPEADQSLEQAITRWTGKILRINRNALRDGDVFARIARVQDRFNARQEVFDLQLIPPEWVTPVIDPLTGQWQQLVIRYPVTVTDAQGRTVTEYTLTEVLTPKSRSIEADGRAPTEVRQQNREEPNPWGFIPVAHFKNEAEENQLYGCSDLEPVEPFMKAYHDTMLFAVQGSKLFSRPKAKFSLKSVEKFLADNFSAEEINAGKLKFADKEIFLLQEGDDASFITADSGLQGITNLLEFIYYCYDDKTEVLTQNGWKLFKDVTFGEKVATKTKEGDRLVYQRPVNFIKYNYCGDLIVYETGRANFAVTPDHMMLLEDGQLIKAEQILNRKTVRIPRGNAPYGDYQSDAIIEWFNLPTTCTPVWKSGRRQHKIQDGKLVKNKGGRWPQEYPPLPPARIEDFAAFLGLWLSEGTIVAQQAIITQAKKNIIPKIDAVFQKLGWPYSRHEYPPHDAKHLSTVRWAIASSHLVAYLKGLRDLQKDERCVPDEAFTIWPVKAVRALIDGLMWGDGTFDSRQGRYTCYSTISKRLADDIQRLLIHLGISSRVQLIRPAGKIGNSISGHRIITSKHDLWQVQINAKNTASFPGSAVKRVPYNGMVYCLEVPNHTLMVRRNGVQMWCGNCIVDVSETPEFAFGTAVASSKASVSEQMVPLSRKIRRKRGQFEEYYSDLASMYLAMWARVENKALDSYQVGVGWDEISPRNDQEVANTIKILVEGLVTGMEAGLISVDAAAEFMREFVPTMLPYLDEGADDDERRRVARSFTLMQRLQDGQGLERLMEGDQDGEA